AREAGPKLASDQVVDMGVIPKGSTAMVLRKGKLVNLALPGGDFEKHVIRVAAGRDVQAVEVQVGRFGQAIRKSDPDLLPRSDFKPRSRHRTVIAVERCAPPRQRETPHLGCQGKV